jgi:hypothetical protein
LDSPCASSERTDKITRELRQAILDAAENVGNVIRVQFGSVTNAGGITAYLERIAIEHPAVMCGLLASRLIALKNRS